MIKREKNKMKAIEKAKRYTSIRTKRKMSLIAKVSVRMYDTTIDVVTALHNLNLSKNPLRVFFVTLYTIPFPPKTNRI